MKYVVREIDSRSTTGKEQLLRISQYTGVTQRRRAGGPAEPDTRADSLVGYKRVEPNDLVINIMLAWNGSMGVSPHIGIASPAYCVYRFGHGAHPWYFHNLLRSPVYKARIKASSTGVVESRLRLYSDDLGRIDAMLPPPDEQTAIVRFLDWANGRLERAIRAKRRVIALLGEQKQAIIHRAVTRGLDPSVSLKPSGIPWLGDIPRHWEVLRGKYVGRLFSTPSVLDNELTEDGAGNSMYLKVSDLAGVDDSFRLTRSRLYVKRSLTRSSPRRSLLVFPKRGGAIYTNRVALVESVCLVDPNLMCWEISERFDPHYVALLLQTRTLADLADVSSVPQINNHHINPIPFPAPPADEQTAIVDSLSKNLGGVNSAICRVGREIDLLREYRTRLVADVVTGKLDVREAAARLPDEALLDTVGDDALGAADIDESAEAEDAAV